MHFLLTIHHITASLEHRMVIKQTIRQELISLRFLHSFFKKNKKATIIYGSDRQAN